MAEDIMISVSMDVQQALSDLGNLENNVKSVQAGLGSQVSPVVDNVGTKLQSLGGKVTNAGQKINEWLGKESVQAFKRAGDAAKDFATECVQASLKSEQEWRRYGALVNSNGGNWEAEEAKTKKWSSTFSNAMGRANSDTRSAMLTLAQMGVSNSQMESSMKGVAAVAARTGMTEAEASNVVASALNGRGMQLAKLTGLRIEDYKNAEGQIDTERLMNDLYNQNQGAIEEYANSTEAQVNRMNNSWGSFKKQIGDALAPVVKIVADVMGGIAKWFTDLPGPVKTAIAVLLGIGAAIGAVLGALAFLAPVLTTIGGLIVGIGEAGGVIAFLTGAIGPLSAGFGVLAGAIAPLILPILAVVAALTALYFIGIQMGWWNDLSGMIGVFGNVLGQVVGAIMNFVSWFALLFTDFPAAQAQFNQFIDNLGNYVLNGLGQLGGMIWSALQGAFSSIDWNGLLMALFPVPMMIYQVFTRVGPLIMMALTQAATFARMAVGFVVNAIVMRFNLLVARVRNIFTMVVNAIRSRLSNARTIASNLAQMIRQQIVNKFNQIIARVRSIFQNIVSTIRSRLANGVSTARQKAQEILQGIKDKISSIPGIVADEFGKIPGKIQSALASAASAALSGAANIVSSFLSGLQRHSPGKIQRETVAEFNSLPGIIAGSGVRAIGETTSMARGIVSAWNGNMTGLGFGVEGSLDSAVPQFNAFSPMNMSQIRRGSTGMVYNNTNSSDNHATHIHVENISLDCNNLTKQESRQILYDALDGLYTGGV